MFRCLCFAVTSICAPALAVESVRYDCEYKNRGRGGWVFKQAIYQVDATRRIVSILDPGVIHGNDGKPLAVPLEIRKNGVYIFRWTIRLSTNGSYDVAAMYRVRLEPKTLRVSQSVNVNDDMDHIGAGRCTVTKKAK